MHEDALPLLVYSNASAAQCLEAIYVCIPIMQRDSAYETPDERRGHSRAVCSVVVQSASINGVHSAPTDDYYMTESNTGYAFSYTVKMIPPLNCHQLGPTPERRHAYDESS